MCFVRAAGRLVEPSLETFYSTTKINHAGYVDGCYYYVTLVQLFHLRVFFVGALANADDIVKHL